MVVETRGQYNKKVRTAKWDEIESAEDVFIDILSRLSVRDIQSLKMVSKHWHRSMITKYFAKQQLTHSNRQMPSYIYCPYMDNKTMELFLMRPGSFKLMNFSTINLPDRGDNEYLYMISSFNGLICCINDKVVESTFYNLQIWICNPTTGETLLLPQGTPSFEFEPSVGVAYGSNTSDYKVFRIFCVEKKVPEDRLPPNLDLVGGNRYACIYECEVYSSSTCAWKNIGPVPCVPVPKPSLFYDSSHVFFRQKIYWLVSLDESVAILSVDLEGRFEVIKSPKYPVDVNEEDIMRQTTYLINLRGSLSLVVVNVASMDLWVWKESSWEHLCKDSMPFNHYLYRFAITSSKNEIIFKTEKGWCRYDVKKRIWKKGKKNEDGSGYFTGTMFPFTESILPSKQWWGVAVKGKSR